MPNVYGIEQTGLGSIIGTDGNGVRDVEEGNVISGNSRTGVTLGGDDTAESIIAGNLIGISATGGGAMGNRFTGVHILRRTSSSIVGGLNPAQANGMGNSCVRTGLSRSDQEKYRPIRYD